MSKVLMKGNEAFAEAAIREGELISKFPITSIPRPLQRGHALTLVSIRPK